jgi:indolepyruvate ferredoxin oxidoreductase
VFGYHHIRRMERALIEQYRVTIADVLAGLTPARLGIAVAIAELPDMVRGYEHIKKDNVVAYHARLAELLQQYRHQQLSAVGS